MKTFIRTEKNNGTFYCSWYDKNGRRYKTKIAPWLEYDGLSIREMDNKYGYMAYARKMGFKIIDDFVGEHPKRINS